jgi:hypothetical protein
MKNKKLYFLCIIEDEDEEVEHDDEVKEEEFNPKKITIHILINILESLVFTLKRLMEGWINIHFLLCRLW